MKWSTDGVDAETDEGGHKYVTYNKQDKYETKDEERLWW